MPLITDRTRPESSDENTNHPGDQPRRPRGLEAGGHNDLGPCGLRGLSDRRKWKWNSQF
jgi:hypothetical protein